MAKRNARTGVPLGWNRDPTRSRSRGNPNVAAECWGLIGGQLVSQGHAICPGIGPTAEKAGLGIAQDHLRVTEVDIPVSGPNDCMAAAGKIGKGGIGEPAFKGNEPWIRARPAARNPARRFDSGLRIQPEIDEVGHQLQVHLRLGISTLGPDRAEQLAIAQQHPWH